MFADIIVNQALHPHLAWGMGALAWHAREVRSGGDHSREAADLTEGHDRGSNQDGRFVALESGKEPYLECEFDPRKQHRPLRTE